MIWRRCFIIGWLIQALALIATPSLAAAATPVRVCVLPARPGMTARDLFARPDAFDCDTPQKSFGSGDFWLLSAPLPPLPRDRPLPVLRTSALWYDQTTVHVLHADGSIDRTHLNGVTLGRHLRVGAMVEVALRDRPSPPVRLLWHIRGAANIRGLLLNPTLVDRDAAARRDAIMHMGYAAFFGMVLALLVYNLALWGALRQAFQPVYCLMLLCLLGYAFTSSAIIVEWLPWLGGTDRLRWGGLFLSGAAASVLLFARYFFEPRVFTGALRHANAITIAALLGTTALFEALAPWHVRLLDRLVTTSYVMMVMIAPWVLVRAWRQRSNYLWVFAITWGVPIAVASVRVGAAVGLLPWGVWVEHSTIVAMAIEALLSGVGIAYRIRVLTRERDEAREQEAVARALADIDGLTGLLNRRAFLHRAIGRPGRQTLVIADLDHFKAINERIGHDGGDEVLRAVARTLVAAAAPDALVARLGGEEFAVLSDAATSIDPAVLLTQLRQTAMPFDLAVTTSIGSCTGPLLREADWQLLYREADRALYAAKAAGRDRACDAATLGHGARADGSNAGLSLRPNPA